MLLFGHSKLARLVSILLFLTLGPATADVSVSGTDVHIQPLPGFKTATTFTGFQDQDDLWFIMVTQAPISKPDLLVRMTDAALLEKGVKVEDRQQLQHSDGTPTTLVRATQSRDGVIYEKLIIVVGNAAQAAAVTAVYPISLSESLRDPMTASLLTARMAGEATGLNLDGLPFIFQESEELQPAHRVSQNLVLCPDGTVLAEASGPIFLGFSPLNVARVDEPESFVVAELETVYADLVLSKPESLTLGECRAFEFTGSGTDRKSGTSTAVYFLLLHHPRTGVHLSAYGGTPSGEKETWLPRFQAVGRTLRPKATD